MRIRPSMGLVLLPALSVGCGGATGAVQGGDPLFDAALVTQPVMGTITSTNDAGGEAGPVLTTNTTNPDCQDGGPSSGDTWTDLYTCYFGTSGPDSCAGSPGMCHGAPGDLGASSAWLCGMTADSCYTGMTGYNLPKPTSGSDPTSALLYTVLCKSDGSGLMPLGCPDPPSIQLYPADMQRIASWIQAGAPQN